MTGVENASFYFDTRPDITLILKATIAVLNAKAISPCAQARRRICLDEISTSDTWNVIPITKEKYTKSR
jgi:hypothetical protein